MYKEPWHGPEDGFGVPKEGLAWPKVVFGT